MRHTITNFAVIPHTNMGMSVSKGLMNAANQVLILLPQSFGLKTIR